MRIEPVSQSRIAFPKLSQEWIHEYLSKRGLTEDQFAEIGVELSQKAIQYRYRMQKSDVGAILRSLGVDTSSLRGVKAAKSAKVTLEQRATRKTEEYRSILGTKELEILSHLATFGSKDAISFFGKKLVDAAMHLNPNFIMGHSSSLRANVLNREAEVRIDEIRTAVAKRRPVNEIAESLGLSLNAVSRIVHSIDQDYSPERTDEDDAVISRNISEASKRFQNRKQMEALSIAEALSDSQLLDLFAKDLLYLSGVSKRLKLSVDNVISLYRSRNMDVSELIYENLDYLKFRNFARANNSYEAPEWMRSKVIFSDQEIPLYAIHHSDLYRAIRLSMDKETVQRVIDSNRIRNATELTGMFSFWKMQTYLEEVLDGMNLIFVEETLDEWIHRTHSLSADDLVMAIKNTLPSVNSLNGLCNVLDAPHSAVARLIDDRSIETNFDSMSKPEKIVSGILDSIGTNYVIHDRKALCGLEIDLLLPDLSLGIEVNPTHTHNSSFGFHYKGVPRPKEYHLEKSKKARDAGITLIHVYDDDLLDLQKLESFLRQRIVGADRVYYGRSTLVEEAVTRNALDDARNFVKKHHRQSLVPAQRYLTMKLRATGELLAVASFSPVNIHGADWELKRMCFAPGVQVRFGISKFISAFSRVVPTAKKLLTYSNIDYGYNNSYELAGFSLIGETGPSLTWINPEDPSDRYSWSVATSWSGKQGVIAKKLGSMEISSKEAEEIVETKLPRRKGSVRGYAKLYKAGSKVLVKDL